MRVLHVGDIAGISSIIAKYMDRFFGTESSVVQRKIFDRDNITASYGGKLWDCGPRMFAFKCLWETKKVDLVHVHSYDKLVPYLKLLYPKKTVALHYHGTDIRGKWGLKQKYWGKADAILYSTSDLSEDETPKHAVYTPNPVDMEVFYPRNTRPKPKTAFHIFYNANDLAEEYADKYGLDLTIHDWRKKGRITYLKLPEVLCQYEYYVDVRRADSKRLFKTPLSKTALEVLACGLKVITWNGKVIKGLPPENYPEEVAKQIFNRYLQLADQKKKVV